MKNVLKKIITPVIQSNWYSDLLLAIPRVLCGYFLAVNFGGSKFGVPWSPKGSPDLGFLEVVEWFPKDIAEYGGIFAMFPVFFAWIGAASEAIGGIFMMIGLKTRVAAFFIMCTMLVAIVFQKWDQGLWGALPAMGFLWLSIHNLILGSGRFGIDYVLTKKWSNDKFFKTQLNLKTLIMKSIIFSIFLVSATGISQIKGNKKIETRTFSIENVETIKINFYAKIIIDQSADESLSITTDTNLFDLINKDVENGILHLDQKEWIQSSEDVKITIGAPYIRKVISGTHDNTSIINLDNKYLQIIAPIGNIIVKGKTDELRIGSEQGIIDASNLIAQNAKVDIWGRGKAIVTVMDTLDTKIENDGKLVITNTPKELKGNAKQVLRKKKIDNSIRYIKFKIKNNSISRNHFFVVGPKPDGSKFSYGFPMMPLATRKENWTVGTKIYKVNSLGIRKLLVKISEQDEGQTVRLF